MQPSVLVQRQVTMIPTLPGTSDIPVGPERPEPVRVPPPVARASVDELEMLKRVLRELQTRVENLEARMARLEVPVPRA